MTKVYLGIIGLVVLAFGVVALLLLTPNNPSAPVVSQPRKIPLKCVANCDLYPVNKTFSLSTDYTPNIEPTGLPGGGWATPETTTALANLFTLANSMGLQPVIVSAYRSFADQEKAFNYWVQQEIHNGYDEATAKERANQYSAMPGHSEHQLGTTVDLRCNKCEAFVESDGNIALYEFIKSEAYKYGFIISYPEGKESLTGYKYEPWHIRFIGITQATKLQEFDYLNPANNIYPQGFLADLAAK